MSSVKRILFIDNDNDNENFISETQFHILFISIHNKLKNNNNKEHPKYENINNYINDYFISISIRLSSI